MPAGKPNNELTTSEKEALRAYREHLDKYGAPPTLRQLGEYLGIVHSAAQYTLRRLHEKGYMQEKRVTSTRLMLSSKGKKAPL
jgi:DNA-binding MarR family transcriptional regulator